MKKQPANEEENNMKLTILGTGNAQVTHCYNTCFVLEDGGKCLLVDAGGGSQVLARLEQTGYSWKDMRDIFVTHKHIDHLLGIIWMLRLFLQGMSRGQVDGDVRLYGHDEVIALLRQLCDLLLEPKETKYIDDRFHFITVSDGETRTIIGRDFTFFDILSTKAKQYGFTVPYGGKRLTCCGDEPCPRRAEQYVENCDWLLHESFCLYEDREIFQPYKKAHTTVKDAAELAERLGVKNLILYHTEDKNMAGRKANYTAEGIQYYHGNLFVPEDMEVFEL